MITKHRRRLIRLWFSELWEENKVTIVYLVSLAALVGVILLVVIIKSKYPTV